MAKVSFTAMKLKTKDEVAKIQIADKEVEVKKYLPVTDKNSIIEMTLQNATVGTVLNTLLMDAYFHTYLVIEYTNINFTDTQKADILKLYDILETNGVISAVITVLEAEGNKEYSDLRDYLLEMAKFVSDYTISAKAIADDLMQYAPDKAEELANNVQDFDEEKFRTLINIAKDNGFTTV